MELWDLDWNVKAGKWVEARLGPLKRKCVLSKVFPIHSPQCSVALVAHLRCVPFLPRASQPHRMVELRRSFGTGHEPKDQDDADQAAAAQTLSRHREEGAFGRWHFFFCKTKNGSMSSNPSMAIKLEDLLTNPQGGKFFPVCGSTSLHLLKL